MDKNIPDLLACYGLEEKRAALWRESADNLVYVVGSDEKILRVSKRLGAGELGFEHAVLKGLAEEDFPVPGWNLTEDGRICAEADGRGAVLFDFLSGQTATDPSLEQCRTAGANLARLHACTRKLDISAPRRRDIFTELERATGQADILRDRFEGGGKFVSEVEQALAWGRADRSEAGVLHNDYRPGNVLFSAAGELCGTLDFDWCCRGPLLKDLALGALEWSWPDGADACDREKFDSFLAGYGTVSGLARDRKVLDGWIRLAALSDAATYFCDLLAIPGEGRRPLKSFMYKKYLGWRL